MNDQRFNSLNHLNEYLRYKMFTKKKKGEEKRCIYSAIYTTTYKYNQYCE